jgi:periplasmic protein CpxP/Spy
MACIGNRPLAATAQIVSAALILIGASAHGLTASPQGSDQHVPAAPPSAAPDGGPSLTGRPRASQQQLPVDEALLEARISKLHQDLQITRAQEPQFAAFADTMRSNARAMHAVLLEQIKNMDLKAVNALLFFQKRIAIENESLKKLVPAFQTLYANMSNQQKVDADTIFHFHLAELVASAPTIERDVRDTAVCSCRHEGQSGGK